jgi:hypothetical protein
MSNLPSFTSGSFPSRLDQATSEELTKGTRSQLSPLPDGVSTYLPRAIFAQKPELLFAPDELYFPKDGKRKWKAGEIYHAMRGWMFPYFRSRFLPGDFHPLIAYLFGVPGELCTSLNYQGCWYERSLLWREEKSIRRSRS